MFGEEDDHNVGKDPASAGGLVDESDDSFDAQRRRATSELDLAKHMMLADGAATQSFGANAAQRWAGTPSIGLSMFKRRNPIYGETGRSIHGQPVIGQRIDASTHFATPPSGLIGGKALEYQQAGYKDRGMGSAFTPTSEWSRMFPGQASSSSVPARLPVNRDPVQEYQGPVGASGQRYGNPGTFRYISSPYGDAKAEDMHAY